MSVFMYGLFESLILAYTEACYHAITIAVVKKKAQIMLKQVLHDTCHWPKYQIPV